MYGYPPRVDCVSKLKSLLGEPGCGFLKLLTSIFKLIPFQFLGLTRSVFVLAVSPSQSFPPLPRRLQSFPPLPGMSPDTCKQSLKPRVRVRGVSTILADQGGWPGGRNQSAAVVPILECTVATLKGALPDCFLRLVAYAGSC